MFANSEIRGTDAAGFWAVQNNDKILHHKNPCKSSDLVLRNVWKIEDCNLMLTHARGASKGVGEPRCNRNNHPFTNSTKNVGLIHNGRIEDHEYETLKKKYDVHSDCDSEILLRIVEGANTKLDGICDVFSLINEGHMAVAIGSLDENRNLWLFRNKHRPLWVVDLRDYLGQVFFVSEPRIWDESIKCKTLHHLGFCQKLIELPTEEVWHMKLDDVVKIEKYSAIKDFSKATVWQDDGKRVSIFSEDRSELEIKALEIKELVGNLAVSAKNLDKDDFKNVVEKLNSIRNDLENLYNIVELS